MKSIARPPGLLGVREFARRGHSCNSTLDAGVSLIELIVALAIISLISAVIVTAVHQLLNRSVQANDQQRAVSQLRQAEHYITRDVLMTHTTPTDNETAFLLLSIDDEVEGVRTYTSYTLVGEGEYRQLTRVTTLYDISDPTNPVPLPDDGTTLIVAEGIFTASSWEYSASNLTVTLVVRSGTHEETRVFDVMPRKTQLNVYEPPAG